MRPLILYFFIMSTICIYRVVGSRISRHSAAFLCRLPPHANDGYRALFSGESTTSNDNDNDLDSKYMNLAIDYARNGFGKTFPNPAVGCVLVDSSEERILGAGFHPRAGFPHAEVFALLEASESVESGVKAAMAVVDGEESSTLYQQVVKLTAQYASPEGPSSLFGGIFQTTPVTAYVTLEPCCHYGKTPPCASSLEIAGIGRVVIGFRDPNPRVNGGGVKVLQDAGVAVDYASGKQAEECAKLVECFVKRILPRESVEVTGGMRRALRSLAGRLKSNNKLAIKSWPSSGPSVDPVINEILQQVDELPLDPSWMEDLDACLWGKELVQLRLGNAVAKKKAAKRLGERIAAELHAHVAQVVGHTVLLYRPGIPPVLDLEELVSEKRSNSTSSSGGG